MATIEPRKRADGTTAYRVKWRFGGKRDGAPQSVTYDEHGDAKRMKGAAEAVGHLIYACDPKVVTFELVAGQRPDAPVFTDPLRGGWWRQHKVNHAWAVARKAAQKAGLSKSPRMHDLRHTHAAWLLSDGVSLIA
jgi:hypothetical protein